MAASEFVVVDVGAESVKLGSSLTILAVAASLDEARAKAREAQPRSAFVAILERKEFHKRKPRIDLEPVESSIVKTDPPKEDK